jgi:uncharacterized protein YgiM (DUF1202 family)
VRPAYEQKKTVNIAGFNKNLPRPIIFVNLKEQINFMTQIVIDKKKYVLVPEKEYQALQKKAALKITPDKALTVEEARAYSKKLIRKWATAK